MHTTTRRIKVLAVAIGLLLAAQTAVLAANLRNGGTVTAVLTATAKNYVQTSALTYVDVPGMSVTVTVPENQQGLLVITFSGQSVCTDLSAPPTVFCVVRVLVNSTPAQPGETVFDNALEGGNHETNSMQFVAGALAPGTYTVKVQYLVDEDMSYFGLEDRTLTVLRSKV